jgi:uncharacterized membrane protein
VPGTDLGRLAGLSDGIFAVGMTLLVLNLAVPDLGSSGTESGLLRALRDLGPSVLVYTMSFAHLGIVWNGHSVQFSRLARTNRHYAWLTLLFLFAVTLVPFSTALLARNPTLKVALVVYWLNVVVLGFGLLASSEYARHANLYEEANVADVVRLFRARVLISQALYAIAVSLSLVFPTWVSIAGIVLIQLNYVLASRIPFLDRF